MKNKYNIQPYGNCPVQADGVLPDGTPYYFRARGESWAMSIGENPVDISCGFAVGFCHREEYKDGNPYEAGWMTEKEAIRFATIAIEAFYKHTDI